MVWLSRLVQTKKAFGSGLYIPQRGTWGGGKPYFFVEKVFLRNTLILIEDFTRSPLPSPDGGPDLFYQPVDKSNWTMLDIGFVKSHLVNQQYFLRHRAHSDERNLAGVGGILRWVIITLHHYIVSIPSISGCFYSHFTVSLRSSKKELVTSFSSISYFIHHSISMSASRGTS